MCAYALFFDPGRTEPIRPIQWDGMAPARNTTKAPHDAVISGLNGTASALAVYASSAGLLRTRRKTRFWLLAKLYQAGLITRRVLAKGFQDVSYISSSFPKLPGARTSYFSSTKSTMALILLYWSHFGTRRTSPSYERIFPSLRVNPSCSK